MEQNLFLALLFLNLLTTGILIIRGVEGRMNSNMGRTLPTSTQLIQEFEESSQPYARALRKEDREVLAELFAMVRFQSAAIAYASPPDSFQVFSLAMLGGIVKRLMHLEIILARDMGSWSEGSEESPVVDGHPAERDWQCSSDWGEDPGTEPS